MVGKVYGIDEFPEGDSTWRISLFGGVVRNPLVPSEVSIEVLLSKVPDGVRDPLSVESRQSSITRSIRVGVGQLPYMSVGSTWLDKRPVLNPYAHRYIHRISVDTSTIRYFSLGELTQEKYAIPKAYYTFGKNYFYALDTQFAAIEINGDPLGVLIPVVELLRFYYAYSTRLTEALFWGAYGKAINPEKCGPTEAGPYRIHLRLWAYDSDAWILARFHASHFMQQQIQSFCNGIQKYHVDSSSIFPSPYRAMQCWFPFQGKTTLTFVGIKLPGPTRTNNTRQLVLQLLNCSAPFPFNQILRDRDNRNSQGAYDSYKELRPSWGSRVKQEDDEREKQKKNESNSKLHSDSEPTAKLKPLVIVKSENRFEDLVGKDMLKNETVEQHYKSSKFTQEPSPELNGYGTGEGIWGDTIRAPAVINTSQPENIEEPDNPELQASLRTFFSAIEHIANHNEEHDLSFLYVEEISDDLPTADTPCVLTFPMFDYDNTRLSWASERIAQKGRTPRKIVIVEALREGKHCYILEAERIKKGEHISTLILAKMDFTRFTGKEIQSFLFDCARKPGWPTSTELPDYRRKITTHRTKSTIDEFANRIYRKILEVTTFADIDNFGHLFITGEQETGLAVELTEFTEALPTLPVTPYSVQNEG